MATPATSNDEGLTRFMTAVTFAARVSALNAGLMGIFHWNLMDLVLGGKAPGTTSAASQTICLICGVLGVIVLCMLARRPVQDSTIPTLRVSVPSRSPRLSTRPEFVPSTSTWAVQPIADTGIGKREHALGAASGSMNTAGHLACTITEFSS